jgi:hypothetical protein
MRITKNELVSTLSDIDIKINNLHKRSASDFMQLNDHLKDYHKKTRLISENAFRIFETISGGKDMDLIKELGNIQNRIEDYRRNIDEDNERKLNMFKDAYLKSNQLNIVVRNLRQDFTSLKFLSTNYALISNYNDSCAVNDNEINEWTQKLNNIHQMLVVFNEDVEKFRTIIASIINELESRIERSVEIFRNLSGETIRNIDSVARKKLESKLQFPVLKEKSFDSSRCINDIITHLQYHDIIRQKIEHIQNSHYRIIDGLNLNGTETREYCSAEDYLKIGDIIDLQAAQLMLVSKEYQNALNVITRNFQVIAKDMTIISDISDKFTLENSSSEITLLRQIKDQLDKGIIQLDQNHAGDTDILTNSALEKLEELNIIENEIRPGLSDFVTGSMSDRFHFSPAGSGVLSQMISLNRDLEIKNEEIWVLVAELRNIIHSTTANDGIADWGNQFEIDRLQLMVKISRILDSLDRDNEDLDKVLNENREINNNILSKIETVINKNDYCEYFESIVGEVIARLTSINAKINPSSGIETRAENLSEIKNQYTMESERIIHDMVVTGNEKAETNTSDNEIEFF